MLKRFLPYWMTPAIMRAAAVMSVVLFVISYAVDLTLLNWNVAPSSTLVSDIAIALAATGLMVFYLFSTHSEQIFLRAKERMNLTAELNCHLRRAMTEMQLRAELDDREERLRNWTRSQKTWITS